MKLFRLATAILFLLISCQEVTQVTTKETTTEAIDINSLPKEWVRLTEKDGNLVIYNSCDSGNLLLTISKNKSHFELLLHGEQEDSDFEILETSKLNDTIFISAKWKDSGDKQEFKFFWTDRQNGVGRWITNYSNGFTTDNIFVIRGKQTKFKVIDQPCRECWGDECDEIEKEVEIDKDKDTLINDN